MWTWCAGAACGSGVRTARVDPGTSGANGVPSPLPHDPPPLMGLRRRTRRPGGLYPTDPTPTPLIWLQTPCTLSQAAAGSFLFSSSSGDCQLLGRVSYKLYLHFTAQHVG